MGIDYTKRPGRGAGAAPSSGGPPVSLSKVTLTKAAPAVSLVKHGGQPGMLRVNLNWNPRPGAAGGGFLRQAFGGGGAIDLDLGCLYEFDDGSKGVVQALGNAFTSRCTFSREAVIRLDGDDRSGNSTDGENLFIDLGHSARIRRILIFAMIYSGTPNWAGADGVVTIFPTTGPQIEVRLDEHGSNARMCAIAMLENAGGDLRIRREVRYVDGGQQALDRAYGWGMRWTPGRK